MRHTQTGRRHVLFFVFGLFMPALYSYGLEISISTTTPFLYLLPALPLSPEEQAKFVSTTTRMTTWVVAEIKQVIFIADTSSASGLHAYPI